MQSIGSFTENENHDKYAGWTDRYERYYKEDPDIVAFFKKLIENYSIRKTLDCACGPGQELMMLHSLGCDVTGSDISPSMLKLAERNLAQADIDISLHRADYRELPNHFSEPFDAVICWSGAIFHVSNDADALRTFQSMRTVLSDKGIAIFDQGLTDFRWAKKDRFVLNRSTRDTSRIYVIDYLGERDCRYNVLDITHQEEEQNMDVWHTDVHVLLKDDQERLLKEAGFSTVKIYGSYDFGEYDKASSLRLIAVAQK